MSGNTISLIGVLVTVGGMILAGVGVYVTNNESTQKTNELAAKSDEIAALSQRNAQLSQDIAAFTTGGDSYFYPHIVNFGATNAETSIRHVGKYPVRDTEVLVFDVTEQIPDLASGKASQYRLDNPSRKSTYVNISYPQHKNRIINADLFEKAPTKDSYAYFVLLTSGTGTVRQIMQFVKVAGEWKQGYRVERIEGDNPAALLNEYFDEGFPLQGEVIVRPTTTAKKSPTTDN